MSDMLPVEISTIFPHREEAISVIAVPLTVRDIGFYRLHLHIDDLYEEYKTEYLQPYEQHEVQNTDLQERSGLVRLFLLMVTDENGQDLEPAFVQRFAIEMDRFEVALAPGDNTIVRDSVSTPLTVDQDAIYTTQSTFYDARRVNQCRCGWPQTLLVPRGSEAGVTYKLFAMVTDYTQDRAPASADEICHDGWAFCGVPGSIYYPDKRPMGFPFDRAFPNGTTLDSFLTQSMAMQDIVIKFNDSRVDPPSALLPGDVSTSWMP